MSFKLSLFSDDGKLMPLANDDEMFILERPGVSFTCTTASGSKFKANGRIYITTQRLVFCADKGTTQHDTFFEAFEIPLDNVRRDKFNQPIFGACNISGDVFPVQYISSLDVIYYCSYYISILGIITTTLQPTKQTTTT
ncbi:hypothetical protein, variant [Aphanomyces astaci]|uniref:GRAM domain-containing protein n=1 Tax=Aphanomyces astaci TaxID=112090 RepID=W4GJS0_APHAT|nr:hypothetical protein, variant [Aphanomyces astaci]ETV79269.1 hypothetical protein, variant [Aphanomyces astaci]|eukprot:XP_009831110.1 hypothetical protein, variant [Aphanomyces astaci]